MSNAVAGVANVRRQPGQHLLLVAIVVAIGSLSLTTALASPEKTATPAPTRTGSDAGQSTCSAQVCRPVYVVFSDPITAAGSAIRNDFQLAVIHGTGVKGKRSHGTVRFTAYRITDEFMAEMPRRAAAYGNHVQLLLDGGVRSEECAGRAGCKNPSWKNMVALNTDYHNPSRYGPGDPDTWLRTCDGIGPGSPAATGVGNGCLGQGLNHNKFLLISSMPDLPDSPVVKDSVRLTSSNESDGSYRKAFNDELVIQDNPVVYHDYVRYFDTLANAYKSRRSTDQQWFTGTTGNHAVTRTLAAHDITTYTFPRPANRDPFPAALDAIDTSDRCRISPAGLTPVRHARIDAAIAYISGRTDILNALTRLRRDGCHVQIDYTAISPQDQRALHQAHIPARRVCIIAPNPDKNGGQRAKLVDYLHSKYLLVQAREPHLSHQPVSVVYTGSENWSKTAETNADNIDIRYVEPTTSDPIYTDYLRNYQLINKDLTAFPQAPTGSCGNVGN